MQLRYSVTCVTASMKSWEPTVNNQPFFLRSYTRRTASTQRSGPISRRPAWRAIRPGRQAATAALPCAARPRPFWLHSLRPSSAVARPAVRVLHAVHGDGPVPALEARRARSNSTRSKPSLARSAAVSELGCNDCNPLYRARAAFRREWGPQPGRQRRQPRARMRQGPWRRTLVRRRAFSGRAGVAADRGHGGRAAARPRDSNPVRAQQPVSGGNGAPGRRTARQQGSRTGRPGRRTRHEHHRRTGPASNILASGGWPGRPRRLQVIASVSRVDSPPTPAGSRWPARARAEVPAFGSRENV